MRPSLGVGPDAILSGDLGERFDAEATGSARLAVGLAVISILTAEAHARG